MEDLQNQHQCTRQDPYNVALEKNLGHGTHVDVVDLADLSQLQSRGRTAEQETDDNEDRVVDDADRHILGDDSQDW